MTGDWTGPHNWTNKENIDQNEERKIRMTVMLTKWLYYHERGDREIDKWHAQLQLQLIIKYNQHGATVSPISNEFNLKSNN